ncbi:MAG: cbb3-type cytochrome c oxidase subunit I, partial [Anaerolineales bacterium]|nr:cbb3-type cytochrome c oxidase subunit I [Anaerolineales bacterium]
MFARENKIAGWSLAIAISALFIGGSMGPLQKLEHVGIDLYRPLRDIGLNSYYQGLTIHGVLNALVWTTFFIVGFFTYIFVRSLNRNLTHPQVNTAANVIMILGLVTAAVPILLNLATVLFTFYPPLMASPWFYVGLTLVVVGSWVHGWGYYLPFSQCRREYPVLTTP